MSNDLITATPSMQSEIISLSREMDKPNLVGLSYALRHPETWPKDFIWDYENCNECAVGLARRLWAEHFSGFQRWCISQEEGQKAAETFVARTMGMSHREAKRIFFGLSSGTKKVRDGWFSTKTVNDFSGVTADDVADAIDEYLATA